MTPLAEELGTSINVRSSGSTVDVDPVRIRQALQNLVDNALRHGRGPVTVAAHTVQGELRITVSDQGPGFPSDLLGTAFDPFTRGPTRSESLPTGAEAPEGTYRGAGLGLAIVRAVAEAHGGTATLVTPPRLPGSLMPGAQIRLDLPLQAQPANETE